MLAAGNILWFRDEVPAVARAHVFSSVGWSIATERSWTSMNAPTRFQFVIDGECLRPVKAAFPELDARTVYGCTSPYDSMALRLLA